MIAILERGGVPIPRLVVRAYSKKIVSVSEKTYTLLMIFNGYLNAIERATDADSLLQQVVKFEHELLQLNVENPFTSGFTKEGFGVYSKLNERVIFVECETDIDE